MVLRQFSSHLECRTLLSDRRYLFRRHIFTGDLLAYVLLIWFPAINGYSESHLVSLNICKAFDRVWHGRLSSNLSGFGLHPEFSWTRSYISGCSIAVQINSALSNLNQATAGMLNPCCPPFFITNILTYLQLHSCFCRRHHPSLSCFTRVIR